MCRKANWNEKRKDVIEGRADGKGKSGKGEWREARGIAKRERKIRHEDDGDNGRERCHAKRTGSQRGKAH